MPLPAPGAAFPRLALELLGGGRLALESLFAGGEALLVMGHRDCKTTRQTLPYVERLHRALPAPGRLLVVLQDTLEDARELVLELQLGVPVACEGEPYPLSQALGLEVVPSLLLISAEGRLAATGEAFRKADLDAFGARLGLAGSLFEPGDPMPAMKPG